MAARYVDLPLFDDPYYEYTVALEENSYIMEFLYNSRMELYTLKLKTEDDVTLFSGVAVVPLYPIGADYAIENLSGTFLLLPKSENILSEAYKEYPNKISQYYDLVYVYEV